MPESHSTNDSTPSTGGPESDYGRRGTRTRSQEGIGESAPVLRPLDPSTAVDPKNLPKDSARTTPAPGDRVMFRDPRFGSAGHVGQVEIQGSVFRVRVEGSRLARRLPRSCLLGWWPKRARDRSPAAMRRLAA